MKKITKLIKDNKKIFGWGWGNQKITPRSKPDVGTFLNLQNEIARGNNSTGGHITRGTPFSTYFVDGGNKLKPKLKQLARLVR